VSFHFVFIEEDSMQELSNDRVRRTPEEWQASVERLSTTGLGQREF